MAELAVVAVGVFLALWAERWTERRRQQTLEREYVETLKRDLEHDLTFLEGMKKRLDVWTSSVRHVLDVVEGRRAGIDDSEAFIQAATTCHFVEFFVPSSTTLDELRSTGHLRLLAHRPALRAVLRYHARVETSYRTIPFYMDRLWNGLWNEVKKHVDRRLFAQAMTSLYESPTIRLDAPHGEPETYSDFLTVTTGELPFDIEGIRRSEALRDHLLDALEIHATLRGELGLYESLCRETLRYFHDRPGARSNKELLLRG